MFTTKSRLPGLDVPPQILNSLHEISKESGNDVNDSVVQNTQ